MGAQEKKDTMTNFQSVWTSRRQAEDRFQFYLTDIDGATFPVVVQNFQCLCGKHCLPSKLCLSSQAPPPRQGRIQLILCQSLGHACNQRIQVVSCCSLSEETKNRVIKSELYNLIRHLIWHISITEIHCEKYHFTERTGRQYG